METKRKEDLERQIKEVTELMDQAKTIEEWLELEHVIMNLREQLYRWEDGHSDKDFYSV